MSSDEPGLLRMIGESAYERAGQWLFGRSVRELLHEHFGRSPGDLPTVEEQLDLAQHPNLQVALDEFLSSSGRASRLLGVVSAGLFGFGPISLRAIVSGGALAGVRIGPVSYRRVTLDEDRALACVEQGLFLVRDPGGPSAILVTRSLQFEAGDSGVRLEAMTPTVDTAHAILGDLRNGIVRRNVYRGHVISLEADKTGQVEVRFHRLPAPARDDIILPAGLIDRIERQTIGLSTHAEQLRRSGRHLRRGLLLHGAPGTGKTLTAMYLIHAMESRTVILITGRGMALVPQACGLARLLQPSTVVLEDVDLVASERTQQGQACNTVLFDLLNEMDGLAEDADVLFLLTTNRPDLLEPALAARPGRIDLALEVPLPDAECRRRLLALYGRGLHLGSVDVDSLVGRTEGASPAFIRELLRKAALYAASDGEEMKLATRHFDEALDELLSAGGELTRALLGGRVSPSEGRRR